MVIRNDNRPPPSYESIYGAPPGSTEEFDLNSTPRISVLSESSLHRKFFFINIDLHLIFKILQFRIFFIYNLANFSHGARSIESYNYQFGPYPKRVTCATCQVYIYFFVSKKYLHYFFQDALNSNCKVEKSFQSVVLPEKFSGQTMKILRSVDQTLLMNITNKVQIALNLIPSSW